MSCVEVLWICPRIQCCSREEEPKVQHMWKRWPPLAPLCASIQWPQFKRDLMSSSHDVRSYHTPQMSERMPAGSGLWWELLVMHGGTRCERRLPKGRQINYSAWSFCINTAQMAAHERDSFMQHPWEDKEMCQSHGLTESCSYGEERGGKSLLRVEQLLITELLQTSLCRWWRKQLLFFHWLSDDFHPVWKLLNLI